MNLNTKIDIKNLIYLPKHVALKYYIDNIFDIKINTCMCLLLHLIPLRWRYFSHS